MATIKDLANGTAVSGSASAIAPFAKLTANALANICRVYETLTPNRDTLGVLFSLDAAQTEPTDQWITFFVETASAQLIWDERPTGVLNDADATWVLARFDEAPTLATMAILVRLVEEAQRLPVWFSAEVRGRAALFGATLAKFEVAPVKKPSHLRLVA